jgi:hypothetical protein
MAVLDREPQTGLKLTLPLPDVQFQARFGLAWKRSLPDSALKSLLEREAPQQPTRARQHGAKVSQL